MRLLGFLLLFVITSVSALNDTELRGCNLVIPKDVQIRPEPQTDSGPLLIYTSFNIFRLGDVPDSGGSFGMDFLQVLGILCEKLDQHFVYFGRITLVWEDKRYIAANEHRTSECGSGHVLWTKPNQFWLPKLYVRSALELVSVNKFYLIYTNHNLYRGGLYGALWVP